MIEEGGDAGGVHGEPREILAGVIAEVCFPGYVFGWDNLACLPQEALARVSPRLRSFQKSETPTKKEGAIARALESISDLFCVAAWVSVPNPVHKRAQLSRARWMPKFSERLGLDLPDAFASHRKRLANFFQRVLRTVFQAETHLDDLLFARCQRAQHLRSLVFEVDVDHRLGRRNYCAVFDEVAQVRIFLFANWRFEGDWLLRNLQDFPDFCHRNVHPLGDFFRRRLASQFLHQLPRCADQLIDGFDHVHRDTNRTRLIGDGSGNCLPDPPRGIRRELIAAAVFELVYRLHQADVAFLNQVEELQAAIGVLLRNRDHQAQIGFDQLALGVLGIHVALDDLALRALELLEQQARFRFELFEFSADRARLLLVFLFLLFAARRIGPLFQILDLTVERAHPINRAVHTVNQAFAFVVGEAQFPYRDRSAHNRMRQMKAVPAMIARPLLLVYRRQLLDERQDLLVKLVERVDLGEKIFQTLVYDLFGDFLFVESHQLFDGADALLEVLA